MCHKNLKTKNKMSLRKSKPQTLSEKVTELIAGSGSSEDSDDDVGAPQVVDFDEYDMPSDSRLPDFRKNNIKLLSEQSLRYKGAVSSRKDFEESDKSENSQEDLAEDDESKNSNENFKEDDESENSNDESEDAQKDTENESYEDSDDSEHSFASDTANDAQASKETDNVTKVISEKNQQVEIQKGVCVQNQLKIWEKLLELRIHSQKLLNKTNQLPLDTTIPEQFKDDANKTIENTTILLKSLMELQQALSGQFSELKNAIKTTTLKRAAAPLSNYKDGVPPIKRIAEYLEQRFQDFKPYRNTVLLKWDDRTRLLTPGAGVKKKSLNEEFDIIRKIENTLQNRSALIAKSQIPHNKNDISAENAVKDIENESNVHVYDDTDFYHQQLRELIEYKANTSANMAEVTKQYVELQKLRQKMKKKVDTRSSKGRKTRYIVHNKLVNFMAPEDKSSWTEESKNELCKSLFAT